MHRNTIVFISLLSIIAALLVGLNIGRRLPTETVSPTSLPSPLNVPQAIASPSPSPISYQLNDCGITFTYEPEFILKQASFSAELTNSQTQEQLNVACVPEIPKPALPPEKVEETEVAGIKAILYHDSSAKDGSPLDAVIIKHPNRELEIGIFGFGENFQKFLQTVKFN